MAETRRVSLLTAEDVGKKVAATGFVRTKPQGRWYGDAFPAEFSAEVRVEGVLESFYSRPTVPQVEVTEDKPALPEGYTLSVSGISFHVPTGFVVTLDAA